VIDRRFCCKVLVLVMVMMMVLVMMMTMMMMVVVVVVVMIQITRMKGAGQRQEWLEFFGCIRVRCEWESTITHD
jgi:preprotein translocase subunit SecG